jgi:hypothetical protein
MPHGKLPCGWVLVVVASHDGKRGGAHALPPESVHGVTFMLCALGNLE